MIRVYKEESVRVYTLTSAHPGSTHKLPTSNQLQSKTSIHSREILVLASKEQDIPSYLFIMSSKGSTTKANTSHPLSKIPTPVRAAPNTKQVREKPPVEKERPHRPGRHPVDDLDDLPSDSESSKGTSKNGKHTSEHGSGGSESKENKAASSRTSKR
jgi:hypothetical protein